jgi:hypothetical protein
MPEPVRDEARALRDRAGEAATVSEAYAAYYRLEIIQRVSSLHRCGDSGLGTGS